MHISAGGHFDNPAVVQTIDYSVDHCQRMLRVSEAFETSVHSLSDISFGNFKYQLKRILKGYFIRAKEEFVVEGLSPHFVGHGENAEQARSDFSEKLHAGIQNLIYKRPFERSDEDSLEWEAIGDVVDITVFKNTTPIVVQQYGVVSHGMRSVPCKIKWDNGYTEPIDLRMVATPDFIRFAPGQPIRAIVNRDPVTREIISMPFIERVNALPSNEEMESSGFVQEVLESDPFPTVDWE